MSAACACCVPIRSRYRWNLTPDVGRRVEIGQVVAKRPHHTITKSGERLARVVGKRRIAETVDDPADQLALVQPADGAHGMTHLLSVAGDEHRPDLILEAVGQDREQAGRLEPGARLVVLQHAIEQDARRVEVLVPARLRKERHHGGADREVLELAKLLDPIERIDLRVVCHVEERLRSHGEVGIVQQLLDRRDHSGVAGFIQQANRFRAHFRGGVVEQAAHGRVRRAVRAGIQQPQRIQHLRRILPSELRRQQIGRAAIQARRRRAFGVEPIVVNAVLQILDV